MKRHIPQQRVIMKNESKDEMKNKNKPSVIVIGHLNIKWDTNTTIFKIIKEVQYSFLLKVSFDPPNSKNPLPISSMIDPTMLTINSPGIW